MAMTIGGYNPSAQNNSIRSTAPKPAEVFKELTKPKNADDFFKPTPITDTTRRLADSPVYGAAQETIGKMNGLARQAADPNLTDEQRGYLNTEYNDLKNSLAGLGIGTDSDRTADPNNRLSSFDLGLSSTDLSSAASAGAAQTATGNAFSGIIQQQSGVESQAYRAENQDREAATQEFAVESFLDSQKEQSRQDIADTKLNAAVSAYRTQQEASVKREGVLRLLA